MAETKSGFEIRADLLNQSQGLLEGNFQREVDSIHVHNDNYPNDRKCIPSRNLTPQEVVDVAKTFNEFVNQK